MYRKDTKSYETQESDFFSTDELCSNVGDAFEKANPKPGILCIGVVEVEAKIVARWAREEVPDNGSS